MPLLVGTSGWQYRDWRGVLYPPGVPQRRWLEHYASQYATVENNGTFYRLPARETFADWRARTPDGFVMTVKASRYLTHVRRLRDPAEPVARMLAAAAGLGPRLGPVLLQLPPTLHADPAALSACLAEFGSARGPDGARIQVVVEPRHGSWWTGEVREVLAAHGAALCWADQLGRPVIPLWRTAGWGYLRFHQGAAQPWPRYGGQALRSWLDRLAAAWPDEATVYVYFNNDPGGAAIADSAAFARLARQAGRSVSPTPGAPAGA
jgi:uncharacterized protein YecE (DUF72 family)